MFNQIYKGQMSSLAAKHNVGLDLSGRVAVISGGTQGIGAATAHRFAKAGSSVFVIGRNAVLGAKVVDGLTAEFGGEGKTFEFIKADLSLVASVKDVAVKLQEKVGSHGIDYLVETQGGPPNGLQTITTEGHETHFAVQCLSRFGLAYLLAKSKTLKESLVIVCAPAGPTGSPPDLNDIELLKSKDLGRFKLLAATGERDSNVMDGVVAQWHETFPEIKAFHVFPGLVTSSALENAGFPYPIVLLGKLFAPLLERTIGNSPKSYSDIPVYLAANPKYSKDQALEFSNHNLKTLAPKWTDEQPSVRKALWDKMIELGDF